MTDDRIDSKEAAFVIIAAMGLGGVRKLEPELGADYAPDPGDPAFAAKGKEITDGGVKATVEVTGSAKAMIQALECAAWMGRVALLGCTRVSDQSVDYYNMVHRPGVKLIGAHNFVRPKFESYPHHWTRQDDRKAILSLISAGKFRILPIIPEIHRPDDAAGGLRQTRKARASARNTLRLERVK